MKNRLSKRPRQLNIGLNKLFYNSILFLGVVAQPSDEANYVKIRAKYGPTPFTRQSSSTRSYTAAVHGGNVYRHGASRAYVNRADLLRANAKEGIMVHLYDAGMGTRSLDKQTLVVSNPFSSSPSYKLHRPFFWVIWY